MAEYHSIRELLEICECGNQKIWEVVMEQEAAESGLTEEQVFQKMERMYEAMRLADENYDAELVQPVETVRRCVHIMPVGRISVVRIPVWRWKRHLRWQSPMLV